MVSWYRGTVVPFRYRGTIQVPWYHSGTVVPFRYRGTIQVLVVDIIKEPYIKYIAKYIRKYIGNIYIYRKYSYKS